MQPFKRSYGNWRFFDKLGIQSDGIMHRTSGNNIMAMP
jgi:hypothetical protein